MRIKSGARYEMFPTKRAAVALLSDGKHHWFLLVRWLVGLGLVGVFTV